MKNFLVGLQTLLGFLTTVGVALAEEAAAEGGGSGYDAMAVLWYALIGIILVWGAYDSFFRPID